MQIDLTKTHSSSVTILKFLSSGKVLCMRLYIFLRWRAIYRVLVLLLLQASEMGMLQHRLRAEENTTRSLRDELESKSKEIAELEDQLRMYETLVKTDHNQLSSTPFIRSNTKGMRRGVLDFKTPLSKYVFRIPLCFD